MEQKVSSLESLLEGRIRGNQLMLSGVHLSPVEARLLWDSEKMKEISWLDLDDNGLGDEGVSDLAECRFLVNVQYLNLNKNGITDEGVKRLAESRFLPKLKRLHLKSNPIMGEGVVALFNSQTLEGLETLQINDGWTSKKRAGWRYKSNQ